MRDTRHTKKWASGIGKELTKACFQRATTQKQCKTSHSFRGTGPSAFEGGKSQSNSKEVAREGVQGTMRILKFLGMLQPEFEIEKPKSDSLLVAKSSWMRAKKSGLLHCKTTIGKYVEKGEVLASITDPYGKMRYLEKAPNHGYIINVNESPIVYKGDAIFRITNEMVK